MMLGRSGKMPTTSVRRRISRFSRSTLLCLSSRQRLGVERFEGAVDLACEVALEAASDLLGGAAFSTSLLDISPCLGVVGHAGHCRHVERSVKPTIAAPVEPVAAGVAGGCGDRA